MTRERTADRPGGLKRICAALASLAMFVLPLLPPFAPLLISGYQNYVAAPKIQYYPDEQKGVDRFTVPSDFRSVRLGVEAHLIIQCGKHVISVINLTNYYKDNVVLFHQGSGVAERENQAQIPYLRERIDQELQEKLTEDHGEKVLEQVGPLYVYVSLLGGVKYQNLLGNTINRQCIIGQDSLVQDYSVRKAIIKKRLNHISLEVPETPDAIEEDEKTGNIIRDAAERIDARLISKTDRKPFDFLVAIPNGVFCLILAACLVVISISFRIACVNYQYYKKRANTRAARLKKVVMGCAVAIIIADTIGCLTAHALARTEDEKLIYEVSPLAEQQLTDTLFEPQPADVGPSSPSAIERLHILDLYVGVAPSQAMLTAYKDELESLYRNGSNAAPTEPLLSEPFDNSHYAALSEAAKDDIKEQQENCAVHSHPAYLYQLERALTDGALSEYAHLTYTDLLELSADAVTCGERFLTYGNRNINSQQTPLIINAEDVALMNGKLFWVLGDCLENGNVPDEYEQYLNSFYAAGFQCMALGREQIREDDPDYAIFCYYMGNFSERLLGGLSEEEEFYQTLGKNSIGYYGKARDLLKTGGYDAEDDMALHIEDGIRTLEGLGFEYVRPEDAET